jgi:hypothetical protein
MTTDTERQVQMTESACESSLVGPSRGLVRQSHSLRVRKDKGEVKV